jgi:diguanylate cyclase (GGDEF)-like protein
VFPVIKIGSTQLVRVMSGPGVKSLRERLAAAAAALRAARGDAAPMPDRATPPSEQQLLQAAVSNLPVGLVMFDAGKRLIICNDLYRQMYQLPLEITQPGVHLRQLLEHRLTTDNIEGSDRESYIARIMEIVSTKVRTLREAELSDGHTVSIIHQPMDGGGWIATHEDITERRLAAQRIHHMARHDALTDLPNRSLFREKIEDALKRVPRDEQVAVHCLDLDGFKSVNDALGHPVGDALLRQVAARLRDTVREQDCVARLGGDEFAVVQVGVAQPEGATVLAQRMIEALTAPFDIDGHQVMIGTSIGLAIAPMDGDDADQLLKNGDMALYRAKTDGRGTYRFFEQEMDCRMQARRALELDLRRALLHGQFELHYQPVVNLTTLQVTGMEALLRWQHPERGTVSPAEFIPLAEEIGLIVPLGEWILRRACLDAAAWDPHIKVAVNISPAQFRKKKLLEAVITALAVSKLPAHRLELEITEGVLLVDTDATLALLHQLRALGVGIAMDDFGTGYSSLSYLRRFPFDKIKIDSSFIRSISDEASSFAIIRAVTGLSTSLGMVTTAEGVETAEQLDRVRAEGCTEVQGFLFSAARPAAEIADLIRTLASRAQESGEASAKASAKAIDAA